MKTENKMQIERLEKNELHKQLMLCFGSLAGSGKALRFSKSAVYWWVNGKTQQPPRHKLAKGFDEHDKDIAKLKKMLGIDND